MLAHNNTPNAIARHPTDAMALRDSPAPIRNNAKANPAPAKSLICGSQDANPGTTERRVLVTRKSPINQGTGAVARLADDA